jgi:hypothetical protein
MFECWNEGLESLEFKGVAVGRDDPIAPDEFKKVLPTKAQLLECLNVRMLEC